MNHSIAVGHRADPLRFQNLRSLQASALYAIGFERNPSKSERLHKMCLELKFQKFNTWQHPEIAETLCDCGVLCHVLGDLAHAESMLRAGMGVWRQLDRNRPKCAAAQVSLANLLAEKEQFQEAEALYKSALDLQQEALDGSHSKFVTMNCMALVYMRCGSTGLAASTLRDCLAGLEQALGSGDHLAFAALHHNLARCLVLPYLGGTAVCPAEKAAEALEHFQEACRVYNALLPPTNPSVLALRRNLAQLYILMRKPEQAVPLLDNTLKAMEDLGTYPVQEHGKVHFTLGSVCLTQKQTAKSRYHFQWVLDHPDAAMSLRETERMAVEAYMDQGADSITISKDKASDNALSESRGEPRPKIGHDSQRQRESEPQGEPEASEARAYPADQVHGLFVDVDTSTLSALNRVQYCMGARIKAVLGVPPLLDDCNEGYVHAECSDCPGKADQVDFAALLARMGSECQMLQQVVVAPSGARCSEG